MAEDARYAFLHGGGQGSWVWRATLDALDLQTGGAFGRAELLDVPGCGTKRGRKTDTLTIEDVAAELLGDLDRADMRDVVLVGHSQAGQAMAFMVTMRPDLFRRLVYISCSLPLPGQTVLEMIGTGVHGSDPDEVGWPLDPRASDMAERARVMFCNDMPHEQAASFLAGLGGDSWPMQSYAATNWSFDGLGAVPASYVLCLRDGILPLAWQEIFAARFHAERLIRIDAGHQVMNTRPHALAEALRLEAARAG